MTSETSSATKSNQIPSLSRGQACIACRRKKMRCDGVRPFCGPCSLTRHPDHCEYTNKQGRTFTEVLEERLRSLKARIKELEERKDDAPILLRHPYLQSDHHPEFQRRGSPARLSEGPEFEPRSPSVAPAHSGIPQVDQQFQLTTLIQTSLQHSHRLHFIFHIPTFLQAMAYPVDDPLRPHACLISAIALWALCIMGPDAEYDIHESHHLKLSLDALPAAHASAVTQHRLQAIQAEILLALYFFNDYRVTEGRYHLAAAGTGALACGLHRIDAHQHPGTSLALLSGLGSATTLLLDPPRNALELGERVNLFWTVYALDRCWSVALGSAPVISGHPTPGAIMRSPMPRPLIFYESLSIDEIMSSEGLPVCAFIDGSADFSVLAHPSLSVAALVISAAFFERATRVASSTSSQLGHDDAIPQELEKLRQSIAKFNRILQESIPVDSTLEGASMSNDGDGDGSKEDACRKVLAQSLGWAALIQLYYPFLGRGDADEHCRSSVREIVRSIRSDSGLCLDQLDKIDFFLGIVWLSSARVIVNDLGMFSSASTTPRSDTGAPSTSYVMPSVNEVVVEAHQQLGMVRAQNIAEDLETILGAIRGLGETCPLIAYQLEVLEGTGEDESSS